VREHSLAKVPVILVIGKREAAERSVNMRRLGSQEQRSISLDQALRDLVDEAAAPDRRRPGQAAAPPSHRDLTLDAQHTRERTVA
jgi:threonyl-tRNA synthetase